MIPLSSSAKYPLLLGLDHFASRPGGLGRAFDAICKEFEANGQKFNRLEIGLPFYSSNVNPENSVFLRVNWLLRGALKIRNQTNIVYSHFAFHAFIVSFVVNAPIVSFFHGPWARESLISSGKRSMRFELQKFVEKKVYNKSRLIHCASESFKNLLITEYNIDRRKILVIPLGVDLDRFQNNQKDFARKKLGIGASELIFVSVRRLTNRMGIDDLIHGFSKFCTHSPKGSLYIIGRGPQQNSYEKLIQSLGIENRIHLLGEISDSDLPLWYAASNSSIVPSQSLEGFGLVALESLSCGTPVLASRCGGLEEIVESWNKNFLFDPYRPDQIASKLLEFASGKVSETPENCRNFANNYTWFRSFKLIQASLESQKIIFLSSEDMISGAEISLFELVTGLSDHYHPEVWIGGKGPLYDKFLQSNVSIKLVPRLSLNFSRYSKKSELIKAFVKLPYSMYIIFQEIRKSDSEIVFINTFKSLLVSFPGILLTNKKVIYWAHDAFKFDSKTQFGKRFFYKYVLLFLKIHIVCNSKYTSSSLNKNFGITTGHILNPIVRVAATQRKNSSETLIKLGICGRIAEWKGQLFALKALAPLLSNSNNLVLEVLGSPLFGDEIYFQQVKDFIVEKNISEKVKLIPFCAEPEKIMATWDLSIHAAIEPEPFGRTIVESLMVGVPVIVPNVGGPLEIVSERINGLTYKIGDVDDLANKVNEFLENSELRKELVSNTGNIFSIFNPQQQVAAFEGWLKVDAK
jgi:glycosyltransferase involved in cell wall biosynthesis